MTKGKISNTLLITSLSILLVTPVHADFNTYQRNYQKRVYPDMVLPPADIIQPNPGNITPLQLRAAPGEVEPVSFVPKPDGAVGNFSVSVSDLVYGSETTVRTNY